MTASVLGRPRSQGKRSLALLLREHGVFTVAHAADLALDICDQLAATHDSGIVHGQLGLRCARLSLTREDGPRDVEVFTLEAESDGPVEKGALPYLAPEQRDLTHAIDARADIFAIGAILYHVLTGQPPPDGMLEGTEPVVLPVDDMPSSLATILEDCLSPEPEARPRDIDELTERLASFASWPPNRFARLAERKEARENAERAKRALEARGIANMPAVLDRLDEAAVERARRESAVVPKAAEPRMPSGADLDKFLETVHEATRAEDLAPLSDLADEDGVQETVMLDPPLPLETTVPLEIAPVVQSGVTVPLAMPEPPEPPAAPSESPSVFLSPTLGDDAAPRSRLVTYVAVALVAGAAAAGAVWFLTRPAAEPAVTTVTAAAPPPPASMAPQPTAAPSSTIPVFSPQSLPEVAPISPNALPNAKH